MLRGVFVWLLEQRGVLQIFSGQHLQNHTGGVLQHGRLGVAVGQRRLQSVAGQDNLVRRPERAAAQRGCIRRREHGRVVGWVERMRRRCGQVWES